MKTQSYAVQYPPNWRTDKTGIMGTQFILFSPKDSAGLRSYISMSSQPEDDSVSVDSMVVYNKFYLPGSIDSFKLISESRITLNGIPHFRLIYAGMQAERPMQWIQQGCHFKGRYHVLTFAATEKNFTKLSAVADQIMQTIQYY